jgi:sugar lactone lactonase YvrE
MPTPGVIVHSGGNLLGEGVMWCARRNAVFWVDILAPALHRYELGTGTFSRWMMPEAIGWIIERAQRDDFVIGLKSGFATLTLDPLTITHIGNPEPDRPHNRLNDAKVDHAGRIWAGSKDDREPEQPSGALYRLDPGFAWSRHDDHYRCTNGPTFSPDGQTMYHTDSMARTVYAFDLSADGLLQNKRTLLRFEDSWGYPDGMTTDSYGHLWIAHWRGGRVSRFTPDGKLQYSVALPASQITNCAFAGAGLDRLFVTSAAVGTSNEALAGALFELHPGIRGLAPIPFAG